jgi:hypothetical protein
MNGGTKISLVPGGRFRENRKEMELSKMFGGRFWLNAAIVVILLLLTFWLLYPMLTANSPATIAGHDYLFRTVLGLGIMIILFGKTVTDLLFPVDLGGKKAVVYTILLAVYSLLLLSAIVFMVSRVVAVYLNTSVSSATPQL